MEIKDMQAKDKVNALPSELSLKSLALREDHTKNIDIYSHISFNFFCKVYCLFRTFFKFVGSSDCDDNVSGLAEFTISP